jgi:hypothetical protein
MREPKIIALRKFLCAGDELIGAWWAGLVVGMGGSIHA